MIQSSGENPPALSWLGKLEILRDYDVIVVNAATPVRCRRSAAGAEC